MVFLRRLTRFIRLIIHLFAGALATALYAGVLGYKADHPRMRSVRQWWLAKIVRIVGGDVHIHGQAAIQSTLLVSNHVSWLDIALLGGYAPVYFLSKSEVRQWPIIGWLAYHAGTVFIQRGKRDAARDAAEKIAARLQQGDNVLIFPEGTTTDGVHLLPFHARLFAAAVSAESAVQPVAIHYQTSAGETHPRVPYTNQQSLLTNLYAILSDPIIRIDLYFLPPVDSLSMSRKALAAYSEQQVRIAIGAADTSRLAAIPTAVGNAEQVVG